MPEPVVAALDLGSSKVVALIAQVEKSGMLNVCGIGFAPSRGVRQGQIVDLDAARDTILQVVSHAENMSKMKMPAPAVSVSGAHISCINSVGNIVLSGLSGGRGRVVTELDVEQVLANAQSLQLSIDKSLLHVVPQRYTLDSEICEDPIDREAIRLGVDAHMILAGLTHRHNLQRCLQLAQKDTRRLIFSPLADAMAALSDEDLDQGVVLVNFGHGTCDALFFVDGALVNSWVFRYAGERVTRDIAAVLKTTLQEAEELKIRHGRISPSRRDGDTRFTVPMLDGTGSQTVTSEMLGRVMQARVREILQHVVKEARRLEIHEHLRGGMVITGGGAAMNGLSEYAESVTGMRTRRGRCEHYIGPRGILDNPGYLTGLGLLALEAAFLPEFKREGYPLLDRLQIHGQAGEHGSNKNLLLHILKGRKSS